MAFPEAESYFVVSLPVAGMTMKQTWFIVNLINYAISPLILDDCAFKTLSWCVTSWVPSAPTAAVSYH